MSDVPVRESSSIMELTDYKFKHTLTVKNYIAFLQNSFSKPYGDYEYGSNQLFFPTPNNEIGFNTKLTVSHNYDFSNTSNAYLKSAAIECIQNSTLTLKIAFLKEATFAVRLHNGEVAHKASFTITGQSLHTQPAFICEMADLSIISEEPNLYLVNGTDLVLLFEGTVSMVVSNNLSKYSEQITAGSLGVQNNLEKLFESQQFSDIEICCGKKSFPAHKNILWAQSSTLAKIFETQEKDMKNNIITVDNIKPDIFQEGLYFMYTGKCPKLNELATDLLFFAEKFGVVELKKICEDDLTNRICIDNVCDYFSLAETQNADNLRSACVKFIKENTKTVMATPAWRVLRKLHVDVVSEVLEAMVLGSGDA